MEIFASFIPFLICNLLFLSFYTAPFEKRVEIFRHEGSGFETELLIRLYAVYISGIAYVLLSFLALYRFRKNMVQQFSNTERSTSTGCCILLSGLR
ncbi:hypothetical protein EJ377_15065 [Chryseobacterium arthrosphaerae]|uniref:Uncharacterized protein n=1 Tax=Chryseobacterium arthrosphaerae TaxID=651561 RepID=A0A3S0VG03_9FLAO|nr:hypothetical protein EJ377_15065 [Chryseobacterium arthrosphaerae]